MNKEMEETVLQVAEYSNAGKERITKFVRIIFIVGILALIANMWMEVTELPETFWFGFLKGGTVGLAIGAMGFGILYTTGAMKRIADFKMRMLGKSRQAQD